MKRSKKILAIILAVLVLFGCAGTALAAEKLVTYVSENGVYTAKKISHPYKSLGTTDGIVDYVGDGAVSAYDKGQGDRGQNYAWSAIAYGDYVYVSTNYNSLGLTLGFMDSVLGNDYDTKMMNSALDMFYNGSFYLGEPDGANTGGVLTKINTKTYEVTVLMSNSHDGNSVQLRNCCEFNGKLYFCGSVNGLPKIVEVDPSENDKCTIVYEGINTKDYYAAYLEGICTGIRGLCAFEDYLVVSMVTLEGPQILIAEDPSAGQDAFTVIADQQDLYNYPAYHFPDSIYGGSIWEMVEYNGSVYVSICTGTKENMPDEYTMQSFAIVRGDMGESFTDWTWTPVIGDLDDGAKYTFGIDPERTRAGAGVMYVYNDYLYIGEYNDEEIPLESILFRYDFEFMKRNLEQSVSLYRMDKNENIELVMGDATKMFPKGSLSGIESGFGRRENQYIWRMEEYNGKLYIGTFDTTSLLQPLAQLVNGNLITMSYSEKKMLLEYITTFLSIAAGAQGENSEAADMLELIRNMNPIALFNLLLGNLVPENASVADTVKALRNVVSDLIECAKYMSTATRGFDLYVTEDGVNFETVTIDGFGDPYNHGCRSFAVTDEGLMVGTANPFYACQIWMLTDDGDTTGTSFFARMIESLTKFIMNFYQFLIKFNVLA